MTETKIIIFLNTDSILYLQITWPSMGCLFFSAQSQTFHSTDSITANFSNSFPVHDHMDYFSHLCYIKACQLFASSPLFLLPRNKSQILEKWIKHVTLYNTSIRITHYLFTSIQNFLLLLPPNHRNKNSGSCLPSVHHTLNPVWLHCLKQISPTTPERWQEMHKTSQCNCHQNYK